MNLNFKATNISVSAEAREYLDKRIQSMGKLIDFNDPTVIIDVELGRTTRHHEKGDIFFAEINIHRGKDSFRSVVDRSDIMSAIDGMRDAIVRELTRDKGKRALFLRRGGQIAKAILRGGYDSLEYLRRPARAGWKYVARFKPWRLWRKNR